MRIAMPLACPRSSDGLTKAARKLWILAREESILKLTKGVSGFSGSEVASADTRGFANYRAKNSCANCPPACRKPVQWWPR